MNGGEDDWRGNHRIGLNCLIVLNWKGNADCKTFAFLTKGMRWKWAVVSFPSINELNLVKEYPSVISSMRVCVDLGCVDWKRLRPFTRFHRQDFKRGYNEAFFGFIVTLQPEAHP